MIRFYSNGTTDMQDGDLAGTSQAPIETEVLYVPQSGYVLSDPKQVFFRTDPDIIAFSPIILSFSGGSDWRVASTAGGLDSVTWGGSLDLTEHNYGHNTPFWLQARISFMDKKGMDKSTKINVATTFTKRSYPFYLVSSIWGVIEDFNAHQTAQDVYKKGDEYLLPIHFSNVWLDLIFNPSVEFYLLDEIPEGYIML